MMDIDGTYEMRKQQYQDRLREAEEYRLARELGFREADVLRSIVAKVWGWLSQIRAQEVSSHQTFMRREG